ncbi:MAG: hypothetical protein KGL39_54365 [Patescibacteria group bacterium]|nr:hypothetical protein [Patescibacteria group bacterium]
MKTTVEGTREELIAFLTKTGWPVPTNLEVKVLDDGWTVDRATALVSEIPEGARRILRAAVEAGGVVDTASLRGGDWDTLRGRVGPITKAMRRLQKRGQLPEELQRPISAKYGGEGSGYRKAEGIEIPVDLVQIFAEALKSRV